MRYVVLPNGQLLTVFHVRKRETGTDVLSPVFRDGWLVLERPGEKRRVAPVPTNWRDLPDEELAALFERGMPPRALPGSASRLGTTERD